MYKVVIDSTGWQKQAQMDFPDFESAHIEASRYICKPDIWLIRLFSPTEQLGMIRFYGRGK